MSTTASLGRKLLRLLMLCIATAVLANLAVSQHAAAAEPATLTLDDARPLVDAWPAVRRLADPGAALGWQSALARLPDFSAPTGPANNLGVHREPVWLVLPLRVQGGDGRWVFDLDYPTLNEAQLFLVSEGRLVTQFTLGSTLPYEARPMRARTLAAPLLLTPGQRYELLIRLRTNTSMLLPLSLSKAEAYHEREAHRLVSLGLMFGMAASLLIYSLVNGIGLRSPLFAAYAVMLAGSTAYFVDYAGLGQQFLWSRRTGMVEMISPLSVLLAMAAGGPFAMMALETRVRSPRLHRGMALLSGLAALLLVLGLTGLIGYRQAQVTATLIGPLIPVLAIAAAWPRAHGGERIGLYMLLGWGCYAVGAASMVALLRGLLPANLWTMNLLQASTVLEMMAWLRVLGLHIEAVRHDAERNAAAVRDLSAIAHTDALTGLPNRRGLDLALQAAVERADEQHQLALFLIDLDGFKAVNDRLGHAAGDQLLIDVGQRLRHEVRRGDLVARLGGDEFVVLVEGVGAGSQALLVGRKLLQAFNAPVIVAGQACPIGLTIGFALAPMDGTRPADLMRLADAAMYEGKRNGRHRVSRAHPAIPAMQ